MKKISFILALVFLLLALPSCSQELEPAPASPAPTQTEEELNGAQKPAQKKTEEEKPEEEEQTIMQEYDPAEDDVINVLMIGNSFCFYYVEELYGIAQAAGVNMKVCNVYYSGCKLNQHWTWWKNNESNYQYIVTDENGRKKYSDYSLKKSLAEENWDIISFQQGSSMVRTTVEDAKNNSYKYLKDLLEYTRTQFPQSKFYWHQTWAYQVGYDRGGFVVDTVEKQTAMSNLVHDFSVEVCRDFDLVRIPSGDAWAYARKDSRAGDVLCNRGDKSDNYHDGDEGGGQYLNACVWFETLTGQSCIGNTWRPTNYQLSEAKIAALQQAAHRAVAESRG